MEQSRALLGGGAACAAARTRAPPSAPRASSPPSLPAPLPAALKPRHGLLEGVYDTIGMVDAAALRAAFRSGRLAARADRVAALTATGVQLEGGSQLPADIVVLATGYRPTARELLPQSLRAAAGYKGDAQWLYRCAGRWGGWGALGGRQVVGRALRFTLHSGEAY